MSNTRFATANENALNAVYHGAATTRAILNGVGLHAPAREEDSAFPMENVYNGDRYLPWMTSGSPVQFPKLDIDLGAQRDVSLIALHGIRCTSVAEFLVPRPFTVFAEYQVSSYDGTGSFTAFGPGGGVTFGGLRDTILIHGSTANFRYLRLRWSDSLSSPFALGHVFAGVPDVDTGIIYSPGSEDRLTRRFARTEGLDGGLITVETGDPSGDFSLQFQARSGSQRDLLARVFSTRKPVTYIRDDDTAFQVVPRDASWARARAWSDLWNFALELAGLP